MRRPRGGGIPRLASGVVVGATLAGAAHAQLSASVGLDSDYRYRGVSLSDSRPTPRAALNYDAPERWYAGAYATRAALTGTDSHGQLSGYAGWTTTPNDGRAFEVGVDGSYFAGVSGYDFGEAYIGALADLWSARVYYSPNYYGRRIQTAYVELNAYPPIDRRMRLFAHVGALVPLAGATGDADRTRLDVSLGGGVTVGPWDFHLAGVAATPHGPYPAVYNGRRAALVVGASVSF